MQLLHPYLRAGILLHAITIAETIILVVLYKQLHLNKWVATDPFFLKHILLVWLACFPLFPQFDARSRYQNYKQLIDLFYFNGFDARFVKPFIKSRCQRDAVMAAAQDLGYEKQCRILFNNNGYYWYHFFPDVIFTTPGVLLCKQFWVTTFFTKKYISKINKQAIKECRIHNHAQLLAA